MKKFLNKLVTLAELGIGAFLFLLGVTGTFAYFIFNALLGVMGFFVFIDALSKIDNPETRKPDNDDKEKTEEN